MGNLEIGLLSSENLPIRAATCRDAKLTPLALLVAAATAAEPFRVEIEVTLEKARPPTKGRVGKFVVEVHPTGAAKEQVVAGIAKRFTEKGEYICLEGIAVL